MRRASCVVLVSLLWLVLVSAGHAQEATQPAPPASVAGETQLARGENPEQVADEAVRAWLASDTLDISSVAAMSTEEVCQALPALFQNPPPRAGTNINFDDRRLLATDDSTDDTIRTYSYPASLPSGTLEVVEVTLSQTPDGMWEATRVGYRTRVSQGGMRSWLQQPVAGYLFLAFSLYLFYLLTQPTSFFRGWLREGWQVIQAHKRIVISTLVGLYAVFGFGVLTGTVLPDSCADAILSLVETAVTAVGATDAYTSGNIARAAVVTFYQNFVVVTLSVTFSSALLFGIPAYLLSIFSFYAQAIPFGLIGTASPLELLMVLVLLLLELTSYFLVVAGGGILLVTIIKKGFRGLNTAFRNLSLMLPFAMVLLMIGAWYEAIVIILPQLLSR